MKIRQPKTPPEPSTLEVEFMRLWRIYRPAGASEPLFNCVLYASDLGRGFVADFAWIDALVLVECQGGIFNRKAHGSVSGVLRDIERSNYAAACGWQMYRFSDREARSPEAFFALLRRGLER